MRRNDASKEAAMTTIYDYVIIFTVGVALGYALYALVVAR